MVAPVDWIIELANRVAQLMCASDILAPIGCHRHFDDENNRWELTLFASQTKILGGPKDGEFASSPFSLDLHLLSECFTNIEHFEWQSESFAVDDELGAHISIVGTYEEHPVWLRVTSEAPARFPAGRIADVYQGQWEELW